MEEASKVHNIPLKEASNLEESAKYLFMSFPLGSGTTATQDALFKTESEMIKKLAVRNPASLSADARTQFWRIAII